VNVRVLVAVSLLPLAAVAIAAPMLAAVAAIAAPMLAPDPAPDPAPVPVAAASAPVAAPPSPTPEPRAVVARGATMSSEALAARSEGAAWLVAHQHADGGWASGGHRATSAVQSDVATTAFALLALHRDAAGGGANRAAVTRGVEFVVRAVETAPDGPRLATPDGTQIQRKLGPLVDTHMAALALGEVLPTLAPPLRARARRALERVVDKVEGAQNADGSFDANGWAPVLSTGLAAQGLTQASDVGVEVDKDVLARSDGYQSGLTGSAGFDASDGAGVELYAVASSLRGNSSTAVRQGSSAPAQAQRQEAAAAADAAASRVAASPDRIIAGFGSVGGEEMLSYMMISDTLAEKGGEEWTTWEAKIGAFLASAQNADGSWVGHHCITSQAFATAGGVLTLAAGDHAALTGG
jgi:hypothetical protein